MTRCEIMENSFFDWQLSEYKPVFCKMTMMHHIPFRQDYSGDFHGAIHLNIQLQGDSVKRIGNTTIELKDLDIFLTSPWEPHRTVFSENGSLIIMCVLDPEQLANSLPGQKERLQAFLFLPPKERQALIKKYISGNFLQKTLYEIYPEEYISTCRKCFNNGKYDFENPYLPEYPVPENDYLRLWYIFIGFFIRILSNVKDEELPGNNQTDYFRLLPALQKVQNADGRKLTVEEAAASCNMSVSTFRKQFARIVGTPFAKYEVNSRFYFALQEFCGGKLLVKEIAEKYSFYDMSHFCRLFKKITSRTPGDYQKNH